MTIDGQQSTAYITKYNACKLEEVNGLISLADQHWDQSINTLHSTTADTHTFFGEKTLANQHW